MTLNEAIREAKRGGNEALMVDESWSSSIQKYARGSSDDAERKQSMRETAFDESYRNHESVSVVQHPSAPVYVIRDPEDDAEVHLPAEGLPKFVRELAALMTEEQRRALVINIGGDIGTNLVASIDQAAEARIERLLAQKRAESGPGISALPVKTEPLTFLDEDLLARDE